MQADTSYSGVQPVEQEEDDELDAQPPGLGTHPAAQKRSLKSVDPTVTVTLSRQLVDRLQRTAQEEGIDMQGLLSELLAEAVTLRAWEIIERKSQMRGGNQGGGNQGNFRGGQGGGGGGQGGGGRHRHRGGHGGGGGGGGPRRGQGQGGNAWMEDKAQFLEYVRNQEKRRR